MASIDLTQEEEVFFMLGGGEGGADCSIDLTQEDGVPLVTQMGGGAAGSNGTGLPVCLAVGDEETRSDPRITMPA
eukprot:7613928-Heterocapsa_arctica.AAC.1